MSARVHIYDRPRQPATRWVDVLNVLARDHHGEPEYEFDWRGRRERHVLIRMVNRNAPNRLLPTFCCRRRRPAKNLDVKVFYDGVYVYCRAGKGCTHDKR